MYGDGVHDDFIYTIIHLARCKMFATISEHPQTFQGHRIGWLVCVKPRTPLRPWLFDCDPRPQSPGQRQTISSFLSFGLSPRQWSMARSRNRTICMEPVASQTIAKEPWGLLTWRIQSSFWAARYHKGGENNQQYVLLKGKLYIRESMGCILQHRYDSKSLQCIQMPGHVIVSQCFANQHPTPFKSVYFFWECGSSKTQEPKRTINMVFCYKPLIRL